MIRGAVDLKCQIIPATGVLAFVSNPATDVSSGYCVTLFIIRVKTDHAEADFVEC